MRISDWTSDVCSSDLLPRCSVPTKAEGETPMSLKLYSHPFSSYCQKVLIAFYENDTPFEYRTLEEEQANTELAAMGPMKRFALQVAAGRNVPEPKHNHGHLQRLHHGPMQMIPGDQEAHTT